MYISFRKKKLLSNIINSETLKTEDTSSLILADQFFMNQSQ